MNYSAILHRSWELTKKNKWLWVYGLTLTAFSGGGFSGGGGGGKKLKLPGDTTTVLKDWIQHVPVQTWILLGLGMLLLMLAAISIGLVIRNWAKGGLIAGLDDADSGKSPTLASTTQRGISSIKYLILYGIISFFVGLGLILGFLLAAGLLIGGLYVLFQFSSVLQTIWLILGVITGLLTLLFLVILLAMVGIYAERLIVLEDMAPWDAWKKSLQLAKKNFFSTFMMGALNGLVGCLVGCLSLVAACLFLLLPGVIFLVSYEKNGNFPWQGGVALVLLFFLFIHLYLLVRTFLIVFNYGTWNLFFKDVTKGEKL